MITTMALNELNKSVDWLHYDASSAGSYLGDALVAEWCCKDAALVASVVHLMLMKLMQQTSS